MANGLRKKLYMVSAVAIVLVMLFLLVFITAESNHECEGEDCVVCYFISVAEEIEETLSVTSAVIAAGAAVSYVLSEISFCPAEQRNPLTPVYLKTKLSN